MRSRKRGPSRARSSRKSTAAITGATEIGRGRRCSGATSIRDTAVSYDWNELSATVGYRDRIYYTAAYTDQYYGIWRSSLSQELSFSQPLRGNFEIGGTLGHVEIQATPIDYTHWNFGVSKVVRHVAIDLRYYESGYDYLGFLGDPKHPQYVLSVSYALRGSKSRI